MRIPLAIVLIIFLACMIAKAQVPSLAIRSLTIDSSNEVVPSRPLPGPDDELPEAEFHETSTRATMVMAMAEVEGQKQSLKPSPNAGSQTFSVTNPLNHVLVIGQSLAMGAYASDILSTNQPYQNLMFIGQRLDGSQPGLMPDDLSGLVPLRETWDPSQQGGETIASGFANWIGAHAGIGAHDLLVSNAARGASDYSLLKRIRSGMPLEEPTGTYPYLRGLAQVRAARELVGPDGYRFRAILAVHGEGDNINQAYDANIREWQADYEVDIAVAAIIGQLSTIPMFHTQISAWGNLGDAIRTLSPFKVLEEYERNPLKTVLVGPKYFLPYAPDGLHLSNVGYRWLGEYYAKAYFQHVISGKPWSPLRPSPGGVSRNANVVEVEFTGVVGHLALDTNLVTNPEGTVIWDPYGSPSFTEAYHRIGPYGFEYRDNHGFGSPWTCSTWITSVIVIGTNRVRITLNQPPQGNERRIRYAAIALNASAGGLGGPERGPRGCLRDTDPSLSRYGHPLYNWCVHFDKPCP